MPDFSAYILLFQKIVFVIGALIYLVFAIIIVRQVTTMTKNVNDSFNPFLIIFSYLHLIFAIFLVLLTLFVL
ncbi:MAG: DUF5657 family protein [Candidatus Shapirobacteria bacterium]